MNTTGSGGPAQTVRKGGATQPTPHGSETPPKNSGAVPAVHGNESSVVKKADPGNGKGGG